MRILLTLVLAVALFYLAPDTCVLQGQNKTRKPQARIVKVFMTFHDASRGRPTSSGKRENGQMAAQNRKKYQSGALSIGTTILLKAYKDKKTGKWAKGTLPKRYVSDTMGRVARRKDHLWIDYYYTGKRSAWMERFNNTWVKIEIID